MRKTSTTYCFLKAPTTAATGCSAGTKGAIAGMTLPTTLMTPPRRSFFSSGVSPEKSISILLVLYSILILYFYVCFCYIYYKIYKTQKLKTSPKIVNQYFSKTTSPTFGPFMRIFMRIYNPLHNGLHVTTQVYKSKSIM